LAAIDSEIKSVPEEFRDFLEVEFTADDYENGYARVSIWYNRLETDKEYAVRSKRNVSSHEAMLEAAKQRVNDLEYNLAQLNAATPLQD